ncbi:alpha/beta hydrolase [Streptomyces sp. cg36]|uniref:alpha/beta hydrolase n=1 Tax=Streptomyces sp. cg36 TaxID=3238798 RepID=UPI0034E1A7C2
MRSTRIPSLLAVALAATCVSTLTPANAVPLAHTDPLRPYTQRTPAWQRCDASSPAGFECATVKVPLDYGDPGGATMDIAVSRLRASGAEERRGVLLLNPGGPGAPGLSLPVDLATDLPDQVKRRYDLVGFDPRGVGRSSPVSCGLTADERVTDHPYRAATFEKDVTWARTVAKKCRAHGGAAAAHLTTRDTARDMDVVRAVLGEKKISYLGYSYGTYLGAVYAQMFPRRTDRFVLDSAADPTRVWRGMFQGMAEGAEPAFARWSQWTARRDSTYHLGTTAAAVRETFRDLVAEADRAPVATDGGPVTGDDIRAQHSRLFHVQKAAEWVAALKRSADDRKPEPDGTPRRGPAAAPTESAPGVPADNAEASAWAVLCSDSHTWPRDPERYRRDAVRDKARYPLYGDFASTITPCAFWKPAAEPTTTVNNEVGALILQNQWDPQTPLAAGWAMHWALRGSRMVTVAGGEGHGVYPFGSCADESATRYLTTGRLPAEDLTCRAPAGPAAGHR